MADEAKARRVQVANRFIGIIAGEGRRFLSHEGYVARFEMDERGRVWFMDAYSKRMVYVAYRGHWRGFTEGGTMRGVVKGLYEFIAGRRGLPLCLLGPWPDWVSSGDLWGYGVDAMERVRTSAEMLRGAHEAREVGDD